MKRTNLLMKLLIILPVFLLAALLVWIAVDGQRGGIRETVASGQETAAAPAAQEGEQTAASAPEAATEEVLKLEVSETEAASTAAVAETEPEDPVVHLLFSGDVYFSSHVLTAYDNAGGIHGVLDEAYRDEIGRADIYMANQEFPFSDRGTPAPDKQFTFRVPPERVSMMHELGIDIVTIANNHTLDYGTDALVDTCTTLENAGIPYVGAGANMDRAKQLETIEVRGRTIGFLAASRAEKPQEYQRTLGRQLIDAGADLVIGSHPHVLQGIEYYQGKPIVYSLGNFIFGSSIPKTALLRADVDLEQNQVNLSLVPGTSGAGFTKELTDPGKKAEFYQYMQGISFGVTIDENGVVGY